MGLLPGSVVAFRKSGPHLSHIHCQPAATRHFRIADCRDSGGGNVEPERRPEFAVVELHDRFLFARQSPD